MTQRPCGRELMTDSLRDRIAAALDNALPKSAADVGFYQRLGVTPLVDIEAYDLNLESLADAVIEALGMTPQWTWTWGDPSGYGYPVDARAEAVAEAGGCRIVTRYVTSWTEDP